MFAQTVVVLLDRPWHQADLEQVLGAFPQRPAAGSGESQEDARVDEQDDDEASDDLDEDDPQGDESDDATSEELGRWMQGDAQVRLTTSADERITIVVDAFTTPWPDDMGDPHTDFPLFGAWTMHWFGWGTFPHALRRACLHPDARPVSERALTHQSFLRLHLHYLHGLGKNDPIFPGDRDVLKELRALSEVADVLLRDPRASAWFVPRADLVRSPEQALPWLEQQKRGVLVPSLWFSERLTHGTGRALFETVGLEAIEQSDHQIVVTDFSLDVDQVFGFLHDLAFKRSRDQELAPTLGPGGRWHPAEAEADRPPRPVLRWALGRAHHEPLVHRLEPEEARSWSEHLEKFLGPIDQAWGELISDYVQLDVLSFPPRGERRHHVLVTRGMSALRMTVPDGADDSGFAELMIALPETWRLDGDPSEEHDWPLNQLKFIARLPHGHKTWVSYGHTIPNGPDAEAYARDTKLCCAMLGRPTTLPREAWTCDVSKEKRVNLFSLYFLHRDEMDKKLELGAEAIFRRLADKRVSEVLEPGRRSSFAKRFWIV